MKLALFTVTYSGMWYKGHALSLEEQIKKAKELGFDGISIETRRPVGSPLDLDRTARRKIREFAGSNGVEICALEANNDFTSPIVENRENNLLMVKSIIEMAYDMDVKTVKVFAAWPGVTIKNGLASYEQARKYSDEQTDLTSLERWHLAIEGIREVAKYATEHGIVLALQNHPPVIRYGYEDALAMVNEVREENVRLCLDVPLFDRQEDEYVKEAVQKCKSLIIHSHYGSWDFRPTGSGNITQLPSARTGKVINYKTFVQELSNIGYTGFLAQEECAPVLVNHEYQGIEEVDRRVTAAAKFMRQLIAGTPKIATPRSQV
jgi:sugar phosphate isomerase/epimerase